MQSAYEEDKRKFALQKERIRDRIQRRQENRAAEIIQSEWKMYLQRCLDLYIRHCSAMIIQNFMAQSALKIRYLRHKACCKIQHAWFRFVDYQIHSGAATVIQSHFQEWYEFRCTLKHLVAIKIQRCGRKWRLKRHFGASHRIQISFRLYRWRKKLHRLRQSYEHHEYWKKQHHSATVIQNLLGIHLIQYQLSIQQPDLFILESDEDLIEAGIIRHNGHQKLFRQKRVWKKTWTKLMQCALERESTLGKQEQRVLDEIQQVEKKIQQARENRDVEIRKYERMKRVEAEKDKGQLEKDLLEQSEFEAKARREIRVRLAFEAKKKY